MKFVSYCMPATVFLALAACAADPVSEDAAASTYEGYDPTLVAAGKSIVETQCSSCHATGRGGDSPRSDAMPLRVILKNYDPENLAEDFRDGIHVGHEDMPDFEFSDMGTEAVLAYLVSIQEN